METRDEQLVSLATMGFFTFSLVHNLANQLTQLQFTVEEARPYLPTDTLQQLDLTTQYLSAVLRDSQALLGRYPSCSMWFDLQEATLEALDLSRYDCFRHKITLKHTLQPAELMGNRVAFLQIMLNLLKNSIQALKNAEEKSIEIWLRVEETAVLILVQDSGPGLPPSFQQESTQERKTLGLGIPYIQQHMKTAFQGSLTLENAECGKGCLATLTFPRAVGCVYEKTGKGRQQAKSPVE